MGMNAWMARMPPHLSKISSGPAGLQSLLISHPVFPLCPDGPLGPIQPLSPVLWVPLLASCNLCGLKQYRPGQQAAPPPFGGEEMNAMRHISREWADCRPLLSAITEQIGTARWQFVTFLLHQKEETKDPRFSSFRGIKEVEERRSRVESRKSKVRSRRSAVARPHSSTPHASRMKSKVESRGPWPRLTERKMVISYLFASASALM